MAVPERTPEQRTAALARAQHVRQVQAEVKQMLKAGELTLDDLLDRATTADELATLKVRDVLQSLPRVGPVGARRAMERLDIASSRRLSGLGPRQVRALKNDFT